MARVSPLRRLHQEAEAALRPYGPPDADVQVVETFGQLDLEYAALRKGCVLVDEPHRGVVTLAGGDRLDLLNRLVTQELRGLGPFEVRRAFLLNRKGRIDADLAIIDLGDRIIAEVDVHATARAAAALSAFVITEDVRVSDTTESTHRLALHGPMAPALLRHVCRPADPTLAGPSPADLAPDRACRATIAGAEVLVIRDDAAGEPGFGLHVRCADAVAVYQQLVEAGQPHDGDDDPAHRFRLRPAGWHAFNIARIEAGRPLYYLDFGPDSLPHETGLLADRVSFTKGCYPGQEIVARMQSRGGPKQRLVALRATATPPGSEADPADQPVTGSLVLDAADPAGDPIGVVTSSAISPMLGSAIVCFAMVRANHATPGAAVVLGDRRLPATIQPGLVFWSNGAARADSRPGD